jgi:restriction endonuclease S subunit
MKQRIADIAEVRSGYQFREKVAHDPTGTVPVIQIKDLSGDFQLQTEDLIRVSMPKTEPYRVEQGDVLFLARGHRLGAAAVTEPLEGTIATGYFFILHPSKRVRPGFLAWAINQKGFQERMRPLVRGSHIPLITKTDFEQLTLDVPPLETQHVIEAIASLHRREQTLMQLLQQKRTQLIDAVCTKAATRGNTNRKG